MGTLPISPRVQGLGDLDDGIDRQAVEPRRVAYGCFIGRVVDTISLGLVRIDVRLLPVHPQRRIVVIHFLLRSGIHAIERAAGKRAHDQIAAIRGRAVRGDSDFRAREHGRRSARGFHHRHLRCRHRGCQTSPMWNKVTAQGRKSNDRESGVLVSESGTAHTVSHGGLMDALSDVLRAVRLSGAFFFDVHACAPWVAETPRGRSVVDAMFPGSDHLISYHLLIEGSCWLEVEGEQPLQLNAGDIIVLPHGDTHVLCTEIGMRKSPQMSMYRRPEPGNLLPSKILVGTDAGARSHFVCGFLGCDSRPYNPLLTA